MAVARGQAKTAGVRGLLAMKLSFGLTFWFFCVKAKERKKIIGCFLIICQVTLC